MKQWPWRIDPPADRSPSIRPEIPGRWAHGWAAGPMSQRRQVFLDAGFEEKMPGFFSQYAGFYGFFYGFLMRWFRVIWWDSPIIFAGLLAALPAHLRLGEPVPQSPVHQRPWNRDRHVTFLGVVNISRFGVVASFYLCLMAVELLYPHNLSCLNGNETMYIYIYTLYTSTLHK